MLTTQTALRIGFLHPVHCEDFLCHEEIADGYYAAAVLDGCSSGTECQFASALGGRIIRKLAREFRLHPMMQEQPGAGALGKAMIREFRELFRAQARSLHLERNEQLCTLIFAVVDTRRNSAWVMAAGDGIIVAGKEVIEIDQNNRPDYFAYRYDMDFDLWLQTRCLTRQFEGLHNLSLSTDGLVTYTKPDQLGKDEGNDLIDFVLVQENDMTLEQRLLFLEREGGFFPSDDVGIVQMEW